MVFTLKRLGTLFFLSFFLSFFLTFFLFMTSNNANAIVIMA